MNPDRKAQLFNIIRSHEGNMTRRDIAAGLGIQRLNLADRLYLDMLVQEGLIEAVKVRRAGAIGFQFVYRATTERA